MPPLAAVLALAVAAPLLLAAAEPRPAAEPEVRVKIVDRTPRFMAFWNQVQAHPELDADARFKLWNELDGFAAVPPGPAGETMKRKLFDRGWPAYPQTVARIAAGAAGMNPQPEAVLRRVVAELKPDGPIDVQVIVYAGNNDHNAYTFGMGPRRPVVAFPADEGPAERAPVMAHEFTHAVQIAMGVSGGGWERSVAQTALAEGLAIHVSRRINPGLPEASFIEYSPGWLKAARAKHAAILADVRAAARASKSEDVMRFTIDAGPSGLNREAYYAGYAVVGHWLKKGRSLAEIARITEAQAPEEVTRAIDEMIRPARG